MKKHVRRYMRDGRLRRFWNRFVSIIACIVVFFTTYAFVLPAITLEKTAACGLEEHQHSDSCFEERLVCELEESEGHQHDESCYTVNTTLLCEETDHSHGPDCYDEEGNLTCALAEHTHDSGCRREDRILSCGKEESEPHHHTSSCYEKVLICEKPVHVHSTACYVETSLQAWQILNDGTTVYIRAGDGGEFDWLRVDGTGEIAPSDLVRLYYAYTVPAGTLTEANASLRFPLPDSVRLTEEQIDQVDSMDGGRGLQAVEGNRTPDIEPDGPEYISAHVKFENVYAEKDKRHNGLPGQDILLKFDPYSVEKNRRTFDRDGNVDGEGETISGFFCVDVNTGQIAFEDAGEAVKEAEITLLQEKEDQGIPAIRRTIRLFEEAEEPEEEEGFEEAAAAEDAEMMQDPEGLDGEYAEEGAQDPDPEQADGEYTEEDAQGLEQLEGEEAFQEQDTADLPEGEVPEGDETLTVEGAPAEDGGSAEGDASAEDGLSGEDEAAAAEGASGEDQISGGEEAAAERPEESGEESGTEADPSETDQAEAVPEEDPAADRKEDEKTEEADRTEETGQAEETGDSASGQKKIIYQGSADTLTFEGPDYTVTASYTEEAGIPEGASLVVSEILEKDDEDAYQNYCDQAQEAVARASQNEGEKDAETGTGEKKIAWIRLFDITIEMDGQEIEPRGPVSIQITCREAIEQTKETAVDAVHFEGDKEEPKLLETETAGTETATEQVSFETDGFSVFAILGTTIEKNLLASDGHNYKVTVTYRPEAGIPGNAELRVEEIKEGFSADGRSYEDYVTYTENVLGLEEGSTGYIRLFDISIVDRESQETKYQPAEGSKVDVRIELADSSSEYLNVVHFADGSGEGETVQSSTENGENGSVVEFRADGFSVYSIVEAPEPVHLDPYKISSLTEIEENTAYRLSYGSQEKFFTSGLNNKGCLVESTDASAAAEWYFEKADEDGSSYYIYTLINGAKKYIRQKSANSNEIKLEDTGTAVVLSEDGEMSGKFIIKHSTEGRWLQHSGSGGGIRFYTDTNNAANSRIYITKLVSAESQNDPYGLNGKTFGIAYNDDSTSAAALTAEKVENQNRLKGLDLLIRTDVLHSSGSLLVAENSDIQEWTFESIEKDKYYIKTIVDGEEKYLSINNANVTLAGSQADASQIQATPGTGANSGKWHFTVGNRSLNYTGSAANGFNAVNNSNATTWLNLVEKSTLTEEDFVEYSARKISASDDILSATEKDDNGDILTDEGGNPVYRTEKTQVVIYTRVWNETTKKYEFYAIDHDGSLVRVYESGDQINWIGNRVNSALWEFTEYTNYDGKPSYFYELENTAYAGTYLAPQSESILSQKKVGINLTGRKDGFDYTSIVAWDDDAYAYSGLKIEREEDGSLRVVTCSLEEAADFHFAVITPPVEEADPTTTVATVDNNEFGISIKMTDFNNAIVNDRDTLQTFYLGPSPWVQSQAFIPTTGLVSTNLTGGYPTVTANPGQYGSSLSGLFNNMTPANHLFIQSVYNESGYFEYDSTQNFAHFNQTGDNAGNFTVYNQLGAIGTNTGPTRAHGQFMPYNDISSETGYAHDTSGNVIVNRYNVSGQELPDTDPRKGEPLYSIPQRDADYYFGMELSAVFTQTPGGVDNWGHDIIFEFTGDDDFWFYVDGELVLDLGGVHSALGGSVNFRTGEVNCNGTITSLYEIFKSNYLARNLDDAAVDNLFVTKTVNGKTVHVFNDYTTHEMKMFYMERGGGASNLKMRFNLASVKPGTVELSKKLKGIDNASNKLIQYPYQIWYQTAEYEKNEDGYVLDANGNRIVTKYNTPVLLSQPSSNANLTGKVYAAYKGTKTLIPYKESMTIGGTTYSNVFLLRAGEIAVINFPEDTYRYKIVECGVDTSVYQHVYVNGNEPENEIFGKAYNNTDGWDPEGGPEVLPDHTTNYDGRNRSDFGITYYTTEGRPRAEYTNEVPPEVMRTVTFKKVLYDSEGHRLSDAEASGIEAAFNYRLYLGNEFADQENLLPADMYPYYVKGPDGSYCKWDKANKKFVSISEGVDTFEEFKALSEADQRAGTFTTSMYGSISKIPAGYTVEVRDLIVGTRYKIEEPNREIPRGYTRRESDGYVRMDTAGGPVVYYTEEGTYGQHPEQGNTTTAEPISDTITGIDESPNIEIRNQEGWGLTARKEWTDKDFMIHDPIYLAVYLDDGNGNPGDLVEGTVRMLNTDETEVYWFFPDLKIGSETYDFDKFIVREVTLALGPDDTLTVDENGVVTGFSGIAPVDDGGTISVSGKTYSGTERTEDYTVDYQTGGRTGKNENIRTDTVTNSRPGIQIYKTDWSGDTFLSGAVFTLKDSNGHDVGHASYTSDSKGLVTTAYLSPGVYTLDEIITPSGYAALDQPITITVTTTDPGTYDLSVPAGSTTYYITVSGPQDFYTTNPAAAEEMARITVRNRTVQELRVVKEGLDGGTRIPLSGVHFALYEQVHDSEGHVRPAYSPIEGYEDLVTKDDGLLEEITMSLGTGTYYLREKEAPDGYQELAEDLCFTISENGTVVINNAGYKRWLTRDTSVPGTVSYQITIENLSQDLSSDITVRKTDENGDALTGAQFVLYRKNDAGSFVIVTEYDLGEGGLIDLTDTPEMTFAGMSNGIYKLSETIAPPGRIIQTKDICFLVSEGAVTLTDENGEAKTYSGVVLKDDNLTIEVTNYPGAALPNTGGPGTSLIRLFGIILTVLAGAGLVMRQRRKTAAHRTA